MYHTEQWFHTYNDLEKLQSYVYIRETNLNNTNTLTIIVSLGLGGKALWGTEFDGDDIVVWGWHWQICIKWGNINVGPRGANQWSLVWNSCHHVIKRYLMFDGLHFLHHSDKVVIYQTGIGDIQSTWTNRKVITAVSTEKMVNGPPTARKALMANRNGFPDYQVHLRHSSHLHGCMLTAMLFCGTKVPLSVDSNDWRP